MTRQPLPRLADMLRGPRLPCAAALVACLAGLATPARAEPEAPEATRTLLAAAGPPAASPDTTWADIEELLVRGPALHAGLADGETVPDARPEVLLEHVGALSCGTAVARAAERALARLDGAAPAQGGAGERRAQVALLLAPPRFAAESSLAVPGEPVVVRWDASPTSRHALSRRDGDRDRVPDAARGAAEDARDALRRLAELTGWTRDALDGPLDVRLAATPYAEGVTLDGRATSVVVPGHLRGPQRLAALAHQLAHVVVRDLAPDAPDALEEAVATWLSENVLAAETGLRMDAADLLPTRHPARSLLSPGLGTAREDAGFFRFVTDVLGVSPVAVADALRSLGRHADELRRAGRVAAGDVPSAAAAEALDEMLAHAGLSLAEAVAEHQAWSLEQDLVHRGARVSVDQELDQLPDELAVDAASLPAFGQLRFGVQLPEDGGLVLGFQPAEPLTVVAVASFADGSVRRFPLAEDRVPLTLPAASLRRVVVLVQSASIPRRWSRWPAAPWPADAAALTVAHDAAWPFVLTSLGGEVQPGQVTLSWDTASEQDLAGWIVERAVRASGPWVPLSAVPLPAQSWPEAAASYAFVDSTPRPSLRYHYRLRALTRTGLSETSPAVSVRTLPAAR